MDTIKINKNKTLMIAHRGLSGLERENTIKSFIAAANRTYYGTECDIHLTKDKVFVVCHDDNIKRVSNYDVKIGDVTYQELSQFHLKEFNSENDARDLFVPTLDEYLEIQKKYQKHCIIEIKEELSKEDIEVLYKKIVDIKDMVTFISFNINNLKLLRKIDENISLQFLTGYYNDELIPTLKKEKLDIDILFQELTKERVSAFHEAKIIVNTWTVNSESVGEELVQMGVDFITTNILE